MKFGSIALVFGLCSACTYDPTAANNSNATATEDDPKTGIICTNNAPLGTNVRQRRCTTPEQREADRRLAETMLTDQMLGGRGPRGMLSPQ